MSKFAEECKKRIAEAGVEPREIKVGNIGIKYHAIDPKIMKVGLECLKSIPISLEDVAVEYEVNFNPIGAMMKEFYKPSECQKLYEANLEIEKLKEENKYLDERRKAFNEKCIKLLKEKKELEKKYTDCIEGSIKFENSYVKKHSELVKEAAALREENERLKRSNTLMSEEIEVSKNNTSIFLDEINTLWANLININLESEEGKEKFKELQHQAAGSKLLLELALSTK